MAHLHRAVRERDLNAIAQILQQPDARDFLRVVDGEGRTLLDVALLGGVRLTGGATEFVVEALVRGGAHVSVQNILRAAEFVNGKILFRLCCVNPIHDLIINSRTDIHGRNALHIAISQRLSHWIIYGLLKNGADPNRADPDGLTPLHAVLLHSPRRLNVIIHLLLKRANPNVLNPAGRTVFHEALDQRRGCFTTFTLLACGADLNIADPRGFTVFHRALFDKRTLLYIRWLLKKAGADFTARTNRSETVLHLLAQRGAPGGESFNSLVSCFLNSLVSDFLHAGAEVEAIDVDGATPLSYAAMAGHKSIVDAFLRNRANPNCFDISGATPLYYAANAGHKAIVKALLRAGANPNVYDGIRKLPLHTAVEQSFRDIVMMLLRSEANTDAFDSDGNCPLHLAVAIIGGNEFVRILIQHGCTVDLRDRNGATALHHAAGRGDNANINTLLDAGANVNIQDEFGMTPLHYSVTVPYPNAIVTLESLFQGVPDLNIRDRHERTALQHAVMKDAHLEIVYLLIRRNPMTFLAELNFD